MGFAEYLKSLSSNYPNIAYFYASVGYCFQALLQIAFKYVAKTISPFQALFMRAFCLFLFNTVILRNSNESPYIRNSFVFRQMLKRLVFSTTYGVLIHYCVKYLPISTVTTLGNTGPIFIFFIEAFYYKKPLNKICLLFTVISFIGVLLIIQPEYLFHTENKTSIEHFEFLSSLVIIAAVCFSMTMLYIHDLAKKVPTIVNLHYSYLGHMTLTSILANFEAPTIDFDEVNFKLIFAFFLVVVFAMLTQYMIFAASSLKEPSLTMPFGYLAIIVGFIADTIFFEITFNMLSVLGILLTSAGLLSKLFISEGSKLKSDRKSMGNNVLNEEQELSEASQRENQIQRI